MVYWFLFILRCCHFSGSGFPYVYFCPFRNEVMVGVVQPEKLGESKMTCTPSLEPARRSFRAMVGGDYGRRVCPNCECALDVWAEAFANDIDRGKHICPQWSRKESRMIVPCTCISAQQDKMYGKGNRVHNVCKHPSTKEIDKGKRCTVCGKHTGI